MDHLHFMLQSSRPARICVYYWASGREVYNKTWDGLDTDSHQITDVGITEHSTTDQ